MLPLSEPAPIRLRAYYQSAGALLRELSRTLNRGHTSLLADSGLPVGTELVLVLIAEALGEPIEVAGTITGCRRRGARYEIRLGYHFDPAGQRARLQEAIAILRRETRRPRREHRIPLALRVDARGLQVTLGDVSRRGGQLEVVGARLPPLTAGSRLGLTLSGSRPGQRAAVPVEFEVRWTGRVARSGGRRRQLVGGSFVSTSPRARQRLRSILRLEDLQPRLRLRRITLAKPEAKPAAVRRKRPR
jgi:hypothetical protein